MHSLCEIMIGKRCLGIVFIAWLVNDDSDHNTSTPLPPNRAADGDYNDQVGFHLDLWNRLAFHWAANLGSAFKFPADTVGETDD